jgi:hypothetical protein
VQKWNAYGNSISKLSGTAAKLNLPVCVLTNEEVKDAFIAAADARSANATVWRIMPAEGPAKYAEIYAAAKAGLNVVVSEHVDMDWAPGLALGWLGLSGLLCDKHRLTDSEQSRSAAPWQCTAIGMPSKQQTRTVQASC